MAGHSHNQPVALWRYPDDTHPAPVPNHQASAERLCDIPGQVQSLRLLGRLLYESKQLDTAEEAVSRALNLSLGKGNQFQVFECHHLLGLIFQSKGESEAAIDRFETALGIASNCNLENLQFWGHYSLARLFCDEGGFGDAYTHIEHSKSYVVNDAFKLGLAMELHAETLYWHGSRSPLPQILAG